MRRLPLTAALFTMSLFAASSWAVEGDKPTDGGARCSKPLIITAIKLDYLEKTAQEYPAQAVTLAQGSAKPGVFAMSVDAKTYKLLKWSGGTGGWASFQALNTGLTDDQKKRNLSMIQEHRFSQAEILNPFKVLERTTRGSMSQGQGWFGLKDAAGIRVSKNISEWDVALAQASLQNPDDPRPAIEIRFFLESGHIVKSHTMMGAAGTEPFKNDEIRKYAQDSVKDIERQGHKIAGIEVVRTRPYDWIGLSSGAGSLQISNNITDSDQQMAQSFAEALHHQVIVTALLGTRYQDLTRVSYASPVTQH